MKKKLLIPFKTIAEKLSAMLEKLKKNKGKLGTLDNRIRILIDFSIITVIGLVIFRNFIFINKWPGGGDVLGMISREYLYANDFRWLYVWRTYSFGFPEGINSFDFFLLLVYSVFKDPSITTKVSLFFFFLIAGFSAYIFAYHYTRKHVAALSAGLVYTLNQWLFSQFTEAHGDIVFSYALAPLLFLLLDRALLSGKLKDIMVLAVLSTVAITGFHPECIFIYSSFLPIFVTFYLFTPTKLNSLRVRAQRFLKVSLCVGVVSFLLSAFTLLPLLSNLSPPYYSQEYRYFLEEAVGGSFHQIADAFTLSGIEKWGYGFILSGPEDIFLPDFPATTVISILFLLAYSTILFRRNRYTYFFAFSSLFSVIISMGPHSLLGDAFVWAWFNVPHFSVFRAANRWIMMAAFSHSFFISILVSMLTEHLPKKKLINNEGTNSKKFLEKIQPPKLRVWLATLVDFCRGLYKIFYYVGKLLLILILLIGFISCFFFVRHGLQVYSPPESYLEPYEWIASQSGNYKVVTVMRSAGEWWEIPDSASDFGHSGMFTDLGWGHDIGYESSFIHDRPVLQDGGWNPFSRVFVDHLRFRLARENFTDDMLKMLGTFDYKYIVIPSYATENIRNFFLKQEGAQVIYNQSGSLIIENGFYTPSIFSATQHAVVVGGLETFSSLCKIDSFHLNQTPLIFAHQISGSPLLTSPLLNTSQSLIFVNSDIPDFVMMSLKDDSIMIDPEKYSAASKNHSGYWVRGYYWRTTGGLVLNKETLTTFGKNSVGIPFEVDSTGTYDIWIRIAFTRGRGKLQILMDNTLCGEIRPESSSEAGLMWANVSQMSLQKGTHTLAITNDGSGFNDIDAIAIIKPLLFQQRLNEFMKTMQNFPGRIVFVKESEQLEGTGWSVQSQPFNGLVLHSEGRGRIISRPENKATATASSVEQGGFWANNTIDGWKGSRWSSAKGTPQWLQIEWESQQEISSVHIIFEQAFAKDYAIQTWNGTCWINQFNIADNTLQDIFHDLPQITNTTKVRIYITNVTDFGTTSIWEVEVYSPTNDVHAATKIFIPRKGEYMFAARVALGPDCGTLWIEANATEFIIPYEYAQERFEWHEFGPLSFDVGEQEIQFKAVGNVDLDTLIVYSLKSDENFLSLDNLFDAYVTPPNITYEMINPCKYVIHIDGNGPFLLIFSESHHPLWKAYIDNVENSPFIAYSIINGYYIQKSGKFDIILYFTAQDSADLGLKISCITLTSLLIVAVLLSKPLKRLRNLARREFKKIKS